MRVGGRDKCPQKQFLKIKEHKILSTGGKKRYSCAFKQAKTLDDTVPRFPTIAPRVQPQFCLSPWGLFTLVFKVQNTLEFIGFVWAC